MSEFKQVKVDNWGIYFLQRLKNFFNRTDYCDLTLQFQDNAQLKVHRLVLSACTEYFELLERTCEMYEDCLVMPDDLQADVVVPIINFMYTGQLEFKLDLLEKLYQTSLIMNLPILTKLLDAHRPKKLLPAKPAFSSSSSYYGKRYQPKPSKPVPVASSSTKRTFSSAFENTDIHTSDISVNTLKRPAKEMFSKAECIVKNGNSSSYQFPVFDKNKRNKALREPRPTRYELPEELDEENIFDSSFTTISYGSKPLMIHPETATKQYRRKKINLFEESSSSSGFISGGANDLVECRKISANENIFLDPDPLGDSIQEDTTFQSTSNMESKDNSHLFDQILETKPSKITIETKNNIQAQNLDHAKIISEVLKKYPHLVKSNKNIKLKILNTSAKSTSSSSATKKSSSTIEEKPKPKHITPDFTYESDVINSKEAAKLIALGVDNISGPWICLICGTPGKALHFTSYFNFRKHLVEVHNEKPVPSVCEYCGVKSQKRNYIVHHKLTKHGVPPPAAFNFPKCNHCDYIALNDSLLIKHKTSHVADKSFKFSLPTAQMANVAQKIGKKYPNYNSQQADKLNRMQCVYCMRVFLREHNLYAHLKVAHKEAARNDGLIDDSEEEQEEIKFSANLKVANNEPSENTIKVEVPISFDNTYEDVNDQYQIEQKADGSICVSTKKPRVLLPSNKNKILNLGFSSSQQNVPAMVQSQKAESMQNASIKRDEYPQNTGQAISISDPDTVIIDNDEYILQDNRLIPKKEKMGAEYVVAHTSNDAEVQPISPSTSLEFHNIHSNPERKMLIRKSAHMNQPYQIVVSNEDEYRALMNSNHSVLYDDGESNRGLSGIVEPDNSSLGTGQIDLDNTQTNDMMIIPDYHMNVPESVAADNSNIVVVYSHPVEDPNKQYSLITTQGHFVPSSAILTQNYQTVTTCTPVVNTHTESESSWQNNMQATINKLPLPPVTELQPMSVRDSITLQELHNTNMNELTEVQLSTADPVTIEIAQTETCPNTFDESNIVTTISQPIGNTLICPQNTVITLADANVLTNIQQPVHIQSLPSTNNQLSITAFSADTVNTIEDQTITEVASNSQQLEPAVVGQILHQNESDTPSTEMVTINASQDNVPCDSIIGESNSLVNNASVLSENVVDEENVITSDSMVITEVCEEEDQLQETVIETNTEEDETIENIARDVNESQNELVQCVVTNQVNEEVPPITVVKEQIENLTSEWSEEESDTPADQSNVSNASVHAQNDDVTEAVETEESIENIQKEINKVSDQNAEAEEAPSPSNEASVNSQTEKDSENVVATSHEKISSLLNDWDDNDSQEDQQPAISEHNDNIQDSNTESQEENVGINDNAGNTNKGSADKTEISKNIKSLVSDWDEDDEEENRE